MPCKPKFLDAVRVATICLGTVTSVAISLAADPGVRPRVREPAIAVTPALLARGAELHRVHCASCHGEDGRGDTPAGRAFASRPADHTDARAMLAFHDGDLAARIRHGAFQMPAFPQIRGDDLVALVAFVRSQSRLDLRSVELQTLADGEVRDFVPVTQAMLDDPPASEWLMYRRTYNAWGYSPLDQVRRDNVSELELAWSRALTPGRQYVTPLAYRGVLYVESPRDIIQALDARTGDLIWEYRWERRARPGEPSRVVIPEVRGTRNIAIAGDRIFHLTADAYLIALDARTGALVWATPETAGDRGITHSAGPLVVDGRVISGRGASPGGGPEVAYIAAHDAATGRELWRFHTIPRPGEPGDDSWKGVPYAHRQHVGSWGFGSYDRGLDTIYWGTSVPAPSLEAVRGTPGGDVLYSNSTVALDPATGRLRWHYQHLPRDNWDLDHVFERFLLDAVVAPDPREVRWISPRVRPGERRRVVSGMPGKTGIVYTLDAATGEFLWARETIHQNVVGDIDAATGRVAIDERRVPRPFQEMFVCPGNAGGKNWMAGAYSPRTRLMYQPVLNACMLQTGTAERFAPGMGYAVNWVMVEDPALRGRDPYPVGSLLAVSPHDGRRAWRHDQRAGLVSGLIATAGGLVFGGDANRRFRAFDDETGRMLWETILSAPVTGHPVSYAVDGVQYVAVTAGGSTHADKTALSLHPEIKVPQGLNTLFVYRLADRAGAGAASGPGP
ncbi:MAG: PQQ-binding-like beta-propeller repeat protein [Pseudomonadota bacterium]|jgi:alcohol dehydrogenase (cytochrome c)